MGVKVSADVVQILVKVVSGHGDHSSKWLSTWAVIIVSVHKTATDLTHCTASVQRLQCLHTVWPSLKSHPFRGESSLIGSFLLFNFSLFCYEVQKPETPPTQSSWFYRLEMRNWNCVTWSCVWCPDSTFCALKTCCICLTWMCWMKKLWSQQTSDPEDKLFQSSKGCVILAVLGSHI